MNKKNLLGIGLIALVVLFLSSCTATHRSMSSANSIVEFEKDDFEYSGQVTGEATSTLIFLIDFERLFSVKSGNIESSGLMLSASSIPVIGGTVGKLDGAGVVKSYALYDMMERNPGYDIVFYPQYETVTKSPIGIPLIFSQRTVKVTARLAKIK